MTGTNPTGMVTIDETEAGPPFRKGELVVYPTHGVGTVDRIGVEEFGGEKMRLIQVSFAETRMMLRVPVVKAAAVGLRRPSSRKVLREVLTVLAGRSQTSRTVWVKRAQEYALRINSGSIKALAAVVRDLRPTLEGSGSSFSQRNLFETAIDRLAAEFAAVFDIDKASALSGLTKTLHAGTAVEFDDSVAVAAAA